MKLCIKEIVYYQCDYCEHTDPFPENMKQHEKLHLKKDCKHEDCNYWLSDVDVVKRQCNICGTIDSLNMDGYEEKIFRMLAE